MTICGRRLLIVEDEPILRITIADALRKEGWDVDVAEETSRMSRSQILLQAGISVLAQANQAPQLALKLLG